jgi:hypothetical protein
MREALVVAAMLLAACSAEQTNMSAAATVSSTKQSEIGAIVQTALKHHSVSGYLHPEVSGRLPVTVAFRSPRGISSVDASLFGQPVRVVSVSKNIPAIVLGVSVRGDKATVTLDYPPEGLVGQIVLQRIGATWVVSSSQLSEQRPNNSFKPKPLRGSA